jgi:tryptophan halogenase
MQGAISPGPISHVLVLGGGSAGFLAAITLKTYVPALRVTVLHSRELGIIGVGEGTTHAFPNYIHGRLRIDPADFHRLAEPTWKLGIRFLNWGPRPYFDYTFRPQLTPRWENLPKVNGYYCEDDFTNADLAPALMSQDRIFARNQYGGPHIGTDVGYHIENAKFVQFLETVAARLGVQTIDDTVLEVTQNDSGIAGLVLKSGGSLDADLYVDSSGFVSLLLGKTLNEPFVPFSPTLFCDRAVVGGWDRKPGEPIKPYTTAQALAAGWCWQIEHERRINRGYVYSSSFTSDEEAEREFRSVAPSVGATRVVHFRTGRYERAWVQNVVAIGNSAGFVEPLEATSLGVIADECDTLANSLRESDLRPTPTIARQYNTRNARKWDHIRHFLGVHYKFNTRFDTPFWRACRDSCDIGPARELVDYYTENGPSTAHRATLLDGLNQFGLEGYWTLLLGQKVPRKTPYTPSESERATWRKIQEGMASKARQALDIPEALKTIRSPTFKWPPSLYTPATFAQPTI